MIASATGEVNLRDGLVIVAHCRVRRLIRASRETKVRALPVLGWVCHSFGNHVSEHGMFEVEVVAGPDVRVHAVSLAHDHPFYEPGTIDDGERRAYHEGVIAADLRGQREFPWGQVFCKLNREANKNWLMVAYTPGPQVPDPSCEVQRQLVEHEKP